MEANENPNENENYTDTSSKISSKKKEYILIAILAVALLGSLTYILTQNKKSTETIEHLNLDLKNTEEAKFILQQEFDNLNSEFSLIQRDLNEKDSLLNRRDEEIAKKQKEIQSLLNKKDATESDLRKAQSLINSLNSEIGQYKEEIAVLKAKNDSLTLVNDTLQFEKANLSNEVAIQTKRADDSENKLRATFSVSNYQISGLKVRKSGKEIETDKAKRIDKIRVSFDLDPNAWVESGETEIYIAIYKPDGKLGKFKDANPGELETWSLGTVFYSDKLSFHYQKGTKKNISFDWEDFEFPKGTYKIDLYQNGMKIGQESLKLR